MFKEFKQFALKGNVLDLAVGVVIGAAFGKIVGSLVNDIIMPVVSIFTGKNNFSNLFFPLDGKTFNLIACKEAGIATINYGTFISNIIDFIIIAFAIFIVIRQINRFMPKKAEVIAEPTTKTCPYCQSDISIKATKCPFCTSNIDGK